MTEQLLHFLIRSVLVFLYFWGVVALLKFLSRRQTKKSSEKSALSKDEEERGGASDKRR